MAITNEEYKKMSMIETPIGKHYGRAIQDAPMSSLITIEDDVPY